MMKLVKLGNTYVDVDKIVSIHVYRRHIGWKEDFDDITGEKRKSEWWNTDVRINENKEIVLSGKFTDEEIFKMLGIKSKQQGDGDDIEP